MKRKIVIVVIVVTLTILGVTKVSAQAELTLENLAEQLASLVQRVAALESIWEGPGSIPIEETEGACIVATGKLQRQTALKFYQQFEKFPEDIEIQSVAILPSIPLTGIAVTYTAGNGRYMARERWIDCEFVGGTDWVDRARR